MITTTADRVASNTADEINERIRHQTEDRVAGSVCGGREAIDRRLAELDEEWDIERCLETLAPSFTLAGLCLGITTNRKWLLLPIMVQGFFLQHALQGWCPPVPVLRYLGIRTADEINEERFALKALRGDFLEVKMADQEPRSDSVAKAMRAVRA